MSLAILHNVVPELEKAGLIKDSICYDGQSTLTSKPAYVGYIEDYKIKHAGQDSGICASFHDGTDGVGNQHCSTMTKPYFIKPSKCKPMEGGMRRTKRRSARRRTQRGGLFGKKPGMLNKMQADLNAGLAKQEAKKNAAFLDAARRRGNHPVSLAEAPFTTMNPLHAASHPHVGRAAANAHTKRQGHSKVSNLFGPRP